MQHYLFTELIFEQKTAENRRKIRIALLWLWLALIWNRLATELIGQAFQTPCNFTP